MSFVCPQCRLRSIKIRSRIEMPSDSRSDETAVQIVQCSQCGFEELAIYEESRRGRLGSELVHHRGYFIQATTLTNIQQLIEQCPQPSDSRCTCSTHSMFHRINVFSRWNWLDLIHHTGSFDLVIS